MAAWENRGGVRARRALPAVSRGRTTASQPGTHRGSAGCSLLRPNPRMQPTGRGGPQLLVDALLPVATQWKHQFVWRGLEGLQLMRKSLGR
jgi:hypothetical protein